MTTAAFKSSGFAPEFASGQTEGRNQKSSDLMTLPQRLIKTLYVWQQRSVDRNHLLDMNDRLLSDMGIDRAIAMREANKPFWSA